MLQQQLFLLLKDYTKYQTIERKKKMLKLNNNIEVCVPLL